MIAICKRNSKNAARTISRKRGSFLLGLVLAYGGLAGCSGGDIAAEPTAEEQAAAVAEIEALLADQASVAQDDGQQYAVEGEEPAQPEEGPTAEEVLETHLSSQVQY